MTFLLLFTLLGIGSLLLLLRVVSRRRRASLSTQLPLRAVDMLAFRNLIDPAEEDYLRVSLASSQFHAVQRERMRAAAEYIMVTIHNSGLLLQMGQAAALSSEPSVAASGQELVETAFKLRTLAVLALAKAYLRVLMPAAPFSLGRLADRYHHANGLASHLLRLQKFGAA